MAGNEVEAFSLVLQLSTHLERSSLNWSCQFKPEVMFTVCINLPVLVGKPAAADLKLGLATAPVLFASSEFPHLEEMIARRFNRPGDVEEAFETVNRSIGLDRTKYGLLL